MSVFRFKEFEVMQEGASMKINTDGVLLAAFCQSNQFVERVLDIGTGTGVIALMLAQKFVQSSLIAIDIDEKTIQLASRNFENSPFSSRLAAKVQDIQSFQPKEKFDLLISNPPFFVGSLKNDDARKTVSRHASDAFFQNFFQTAFDISTQQATFWLIIPIHIVDKILETALQYLWYPSSHIYIWNHVSGQCIRVIVVFSKEKSVLIDKEDFYIRDYDGQYSLAYKQLLSPYFL